jgi:hypothetical protein
MECDQEKRSIQNRHKDCAGAMQGEEEWSLKVGKRA